MLLSRKLLVTIFLTSIPLFLVANDVLASSADAQRQPVAGGGLLIACAIAYLSRRRAIGGWLLYFYIQLYGSLAFSLIFVPQALSSLNPNQWDNSTLYVMFFLSIVPVSVFLGVEVFAATRLLFRRNEANLRFLRKTLIGLVATGCLALVIDIAYFKDNPVALPMDSLTLIFATIWALYFWKSERVRAVFIEKNWVYVQYAVKTVLTSEHKKHLRKRVLIASSVTFVSFLLLMGLSAKDKEPDSSILFVPIFYSVIAAVLARYLPIRKKKLQLLQETDLNSEVSQRDT